MNNIRRPHNAEIRNLKGVSSDCKGAGHTSPAPTHKSRKIRIRSAAPRYPQQEEIRNALDDWCAKKGTENIARSLRISYRMMSHYRSGQRWIPDHICELLGFEPKDKAGTPKDSGISGVLRAAVRFVDSVTNREEDERQESAAHRLFAAVKAYNQSRKEAK